MAPFNKLLEAVQEVDLIALKDNKVTEVKSLEYKEALPGNSDSDKKEFLADISSFANASGGHLIFGIKERAGIPVDICGVNIADPDAEILRLESIIQTGIEPRLPGVSTHEIPLSSGNHAIIIRIPRSWAMPHRVKYARSSPTSSSYFPLEFRE
jgi:predicted HTH transcriptional regulator